LQACSSHWLRQLNVLQLQQDSNAVHETSRALEMLVDRVVNYVSLEMDDARMANCACVTMNVGTLAFI